MNPGSLPRYGHTTQYTVIDEQAYFMVDRTGYGSELWRTDGTRENTFLITDRVMEPLAELDGHLYFQRFDPESGLELWRTDDVPPGVRLVREMVTGPDFTGVRSLTSSGSTMFFAATDEAGPELWKTDGTERNTMMVHDIFPGRNGSDPIHLAPIPGGRVLLSATEPELSFCFIDFMSSMHCGEPWISDGTAEGTRILADLIPGSRPSSPEEFLTLGERTFFRAFYSRETMFWARTAVFVYDASTGTTEMLQDRSGEPIVGSYYDLGRFHRWGDAIVYVTGAATSARNDVVIFDGTPEGTRRLSEIAPVPPGERFSAAFPTQSHGIYVLTLNEAAVEYSIWYFDGFLIRKIMGGVGAHEYPTALGENLLFFDTATPGDTILRSVTPSGVPGVILREPAMTQYAPTRVLNGRMLFTALRPGGTHHEPWSTDGTMKGTYPLIEPPMHEYPSNPRQFISSGSHVFFTASTSATTQQRWMTDGTGTGTTAIGDVYDFEPTQIVAENRTTWYVTNQRLFRTTGATTAMVTPDIGVYAFTVTHGGVLIGGYDDAGSGLWLFEDGQLSKISSLSAVPVAFAELNGSTFFVGTSVGSLDGGLWTTDGTAVGTRKLASLEYTSELVSAGERLYFDGLAPGAGVELWTSDGTAAGTRLAIDLTPGPAGANPHRLRSTSTHLIFKVQPFGYPSATYSFDGDQAVLLEEGNGITSAEPMIDIVHDGAYYWTHSSFEHGFTLWRTDGTVSGTHVVRRFTKPNLGQTFSRFASIDGVLYLAGNGLWKISGAEATLLLEGLYHDIASAGGRIVVGREELYAMVDDAPSLQIETAIVEEPLTGECSASLSLRLSRSTLGDAAVSYETIDGTAKAGEDYVWRLGRARFNSGQRELAISFPISADDLIEGSETVTVRFFDAAGMRLESSSVQVVIVDPETLPLEPPTDSDRKRSVRRR